STRLLFPEPLRPTRNVGLSKFTTSERMLRKPLTISLRMTGSMTLPTSHDARHHLNSIVSRRLAGNRRDARRGTKTSPRPSSEHSLLTSSIRRLGTPGTMGADPAFGRPDLIFSGRDQRCRTRTAGVVASRIFQHLVEDLLRQVGEDKVRVVRVE